jgi:hypothetical protein
MKPEKPYTCAIVRIRGFFDPTSVTADLTGHRMSHHASLPAAQRAAAEASGGDLFSAPQHLVRVCGPGVREWWYRRCRESARSGMLSERAVAVVYTGKVKEEE